MTNSVDRGLRASVDDDGVDIIRHGQQALQKDTTFKGQHNFDSGDCENVHPVRGERAYYATKNILLLLYGDLPAQGTHYWKS